MHTQYKYTDYFLTKFGAKIEGVFKHHAPIVTAFKLLFSNTVSKVYKLQRYGAQQLKTFLPHNCTQKMRQFPVLHTFVVIICTDNRYLWLVMNFDKKYVSAESGHGFMRGGIYK